MLFARPLNSPASTQGLGQPLQSCRVCRLHQEGLKGRGQVEAEQDPAGLPPADPRKAGLQLPKPSLDTMNHRNHGKSQGFPCSPISISCCLVWHSSVPIVGLPLVQGQEKDLPINKQGRTAQNRSKPGMVNDSSSEG